MDTREPQVLSDRLIDKLRLSGFLEDESTGLDLEAIMRHREEPARSMTMQKPDTF